MLGMLGARVGGDVRLRGTVLSGRQLPDRLRNRRVLGLQTRERTAQRHRARRLTCPGRRRDGLRLGILGERQPAPSESGACRRASRVRWSASRGPPGRRRDTRRAGHVLRRVLDRRRRQRGGRARRPAVDARCDSRQPGFSAEAVRVGQDVKLQHGKHHRPPRRSTFAAARIGADNLLFSGAQRSTPAGATDGLDDRPGAAMRRRVHPRTDPSRCWARTSASSSSSGTRR